ncbi:MAG: LptF/LptG family permease [Bacteroidia bacterium]
MIKKFHLFVFKAYLGPFLLAFSVTLFLLVMQFLAMYMQELSGKDLGAEVLLKLFYYATQRLMVMALPVSLLAGALITFGSMGEHYELAAAKSCGINLFKLSMPLILFSFLVTGYSMYFSFYTIPKANLKFFSLIYDVQRKKAEVAIRPGYFYSDIDGFVIRIGGKHKTRGTMYDVIVYNHTEGRGNTDIVLADSAKMMMEPGKTQLRLVMYHGTRYEEYRPDGAKQNDPFARMKFDSLYHRLKLEGFDLEKTDEQLFTRHQITMTKDSLEAAIAEMREKRGKEAKTFTNNLKPYNNIDSGIIHVEKHATTLSILPNTTDTLIQKVEKLKADEPFLKKVSEMPNSNPQDIAQRALSNARSLKQSMGFRISETLDAEKRLSSHKYELQGMYAIPFNCVVFMLIGIAFGAIIRKGGLGLPALISIAFFVVFYMLTIQGRKLSRDAIIDPYLGAWLSDILLTPLALLATYQATTDAQFFDESSRDMVWDKVLMFWGKIVGMFGRKEKP